LRESALVLTSAAWVARLPLRRVERDDDRSDDSAMVDPAVSVGMSSSSIVSRV
jgi:hypothetical protein